MPRNYVGTPTTPEKIEHTEQGISTGSWNPKILDQFFDDIKLKSYKYDYIMQQELVDVQHFVLNVTDGRSKILFGAFSTGSDKVLEFSLIVKMCVAKNRERYKRSDVFEQYVDRETINANRKFYRYTILIMSGNTIIHNYRVRALNERANIVFKSSDLPLNAETIHVYFFPDSVSSMLESPVASNFSGRNLPGSLFRASQYFKYSKGYIGFWVSKTTNEAYLIPNITYNKTTNVFTFNDQLPTNIGQFRLMLYGINNLYSTNDFPGNTEWIEHSHHNMPIPKDNLIIFVNKNGVWHLNNDEISLYEHYPYFYKVTNPQNLPFKIFELYEENSQNEHIIADNEVKLYVDTMKEINPSYSPDDNHDEMMWFNPIEWNYGVDHFNRSYDWHSLDLTDKWDGASYKLDTVSNMLKKWAEAYYEYQKRTYGFLRGWYHNLANYDNLNNKIRSTTANEVNSDPTLTEAFDVPQYVFSYENTSTSGEKNAFCFFIDGKFTIPTRVLIYRGFQYVYFPTSIFKNDSVIEVERFDNLYINSEIRVTGSSITYPVSNFLKKGQTTVANSLFMIDTNGNFLTHDQIEVTVIDKVLGEVAVDLDSSVLILTPEQSIRFDFVNYTESVFILCANNQTYSYMVSEDGDEFVKNDNEANVTLNYGQVAKCRPAYQRRIRIYTEDGRMITKRAYRTYEYKNFYDVPRFNIPIPAGEEENFIISYMGYDERLIYHNDWLPTNGLIRLDAKISRPFNFAYHDVYMDGFRLTKYDVDIITPFTFAIKESTRKKYDAVGCIEVYEKSFEYDDYIKFEFDEESQYIMDRLFRFDYKFARKVISTLEEFEASGNTRDVDKLVDWFYTWYMEYAPYYMHNGDIRRDLEPYHHLFNRDGRVSLNADDRVEHESTILFTQAFNHNKTIEQYGTNPASYPTPPQVDYSPSVLHVDDTIEVREENYSSTAYKKEGYMHVYDMDPEVTVPDGDGDEVTVPDGDGDEVTVPDGDGDEVTVPTETYRIPRNPIPFNKDYVANYDDDDGEYSKRDDSGTGRYYPGMQV